MKLPKQFGFTLIEVLLALVIITIALTALVKATAQDITTTRHIKEKTISHLIALQGVTMIQLGLVSFSANLNNTEVTTMFNERWYWRAQISPTAIKHMQQISIKVSKNPAGPFVDELIAFRYQS